MSDKQQERTINIGCWPVAFALFAVAFAIAMTNGGGWLVWLLLAPFWVPALIASIVMIGAFLFALVALVVAIFTN